ncbi:uncharacterized protein LOC100902265 isoform X2 [Galendromus occidentalis]|nr:uncharacterized protein LOC100902265 isoform X2 [Galendromus occidentalis]
MWSLGSALVFLSVFPHCMTLDVFVSFKRGSDGRGVLINVEPERQEFLGTLCGVYDSYRVCSNESFRGKLEFSSLNPYTDYNLTLSNNSTHESIAFRTDLGVP